ncbi:hypothetical protein LSH36_855g00008 [Paralvinella palmiformis]|uniref:Uncharacterized protein n=1 Tax=Paralvinella palmiformis TaxID=53620 RepID=A0AAD9IZ92_9ANNE|nr:hypothetical protein LSH36_855g00008 [Paralvinella palmiformis]
MTHFKVLRLLRGNLKQQSRFSNGSEQNNQQRKRSPPLSSNNHHRRNNNNNNSAPSQPRVPTNLFPKPGYDRSAPHFIQYRIYCDTTTSRSRNVPIITFIVLSMCMLRRTSIFQLRLNILYYGQD